MKPEMAVPRDGRPGADSGVVHSSLAGENRVVVRDGHPGGHAELVVLGAPGAKVVRRDARVGVAEVDGRS